MNFKKTLQKIGAGAIAFVPAFLTGVAVAAIEMPIAILMLVLTGFDGETFTWYINEISSSSKNIFQGIYNRLKPQKELNWILGKSEQKYALNYLTLKDIEYAYISIEKKPKDFVYNGKPKEELLKKLKDLFQEKCEKQIEKAVADHYRKYDYEPIRREFNRTNASRESREKGNFHNRAEGFMPEVDADRPFNFLTKRAKQWIERKNNPDFYQPQFSKSVLFNPSPLTKETIQKLAEDSLETNTETLIQLQNSVTKEKSSLNLKRNRIVYI